MPDDGVHIPINLKNNVTATSKKIGRDLDGVADDAEELQRELEDVQREALETQSILSSLATKDMRENMGFAPDEFKHKLESLISKEQVKRADDLGDAIRGWKNPFDERLDNSVIDDFADRVEDYENILGDDANRRKALDKGLLTGSFDSSIQALDEKDTEEDFLTVLREYKDDLPIAKKLFDEYKGGVKDTADAHKELGDEAEKSEDKVSSFKRVLGNALDDVNDKLGDVHGKKISKAFDADDAIDGFEKAADATEDVKNNVEEAAESVKNVRKELKGIDTDFTKLAESTDILTEIDDLSTGSDRPSEDVLRQMAFARNVRARGPDWVPKDDSSEGNPQVINPNSLRGIISDASEKYDGVDTPNALDALRSGESISLGPSETGFGKVGPSPSSEAIATAIGNLNSIPRDQGINSNFIRGQALAVDRSNLLTGQKASSVIKKLRFDDDSAATGLLSSSGIRQDTLRPQKAWFKTLHKTRLEDSPEPIPRERLFNVRRLTEELESQYIRSVKGVDRDSINLRTNLEQGIEEVSARLDIDEAELEKQLNETLDRVGNSRRALNTENVASSLLSRNQNRSDNVLEDIATVIREERTFDSIIDNKSFVDNIDRAIDDESSELSWRKSYTDFPSFIDQELFGSDDFLQDNLSVIRSSVDDFRKNEGGDLIDFFDILRANAEESLGSAEKSAGETKKEINRLENALLDVAKASAGDDVVNELVDGEDIGGEDGRWGVRRFTDSYVDNGLKDTTKNLLLTKFDDRVDIDLKNEISSIENAFSNLTPDDANLTANLGFLNVAIGNIVTTVPKLVSLIGPLIIALGGLATAFLAVAGAIGSVLYLGLQDWAESIAANFASVEDKAGAVESIMKGLKAAFIEALSPLQNISIGGKDDVGFLISMLQGLVATAHLVADGFADILEMDETTDFLNEMGDVLFDDKPGEGISGIMDALGYSIKEVLPLITALFSYTIRYFPEFVEFMSDITAQVVPALGNFYHAIEPILGLLIHFGAGLFDGAITFFAAVVNILSTLSYILGIIISPLSKLFNIFVDFMELENDGTLAYTVGQFIGLTAVLFKTAGAAFSLTRTFATAGKALSELTVIGGALKKVITAVTGAMLKLYSASMKTKLALGGLVAGGALIYLLYQLGYLDGVIREVTDALEPLTAALGINESGLSDSIASVAFWMFMFGNASWYATVSQYANTTAQKINMTVTLANITSKWGLASAMVYLTQATFWQTVAQKGYTAALMSTTVGQWLHTAASIALTGAMFGLMKATVAATAAVEAFGIALTATGIGAIIVAIGLLIAMLLNMGKTLSVVTGITDKLEETFNNLSLAGKAALLPMLLTLGPLIVGLYALREALRFVLDPEGTSEKWWDKMQEGIRGIKKLISWVALELDKMANKASLDHLLGSTDEFTHRLLNGQQFGAVSGGARYEGRARSTGTRSTQNKKTEVNVELNAEGGIDPTSSKDRRAVERMFEDVFNTMKEREDGD